MSNSIFILAIIFIGAALYYYIGRKWHKQMSKVDDYTYLLQREFAKETNALNQDVDFHKKVKNIYEKEGYTLSKHPDFSTDFIAKKDKKILFIRIQSLANNENITPTLLQIFIGQTVLYALKNPLYESYDIQWVYISKNKITEYATDTFLSSNKDRVQFRQLEIEDI